MVEKSSVQLSQAISVTHSSVTHSTSDWDNVLDTIQRIIDDDKYNIDANIILIIHSYIQDGDNNESLIKLNELHNIINNKCIKNISLLYTIVIIICHICNRNINALYICIDILERCITYTNDKSYQASILIEIGRIHLMISSERGSAQGGLRNMTGGGMVGGSERSSVSLAIQAFQEALKKDDSSSTTTYSTTSTTNTNNNNISALLGLVKCQLIEGEIDDAEAQLDLLTAMHEENELGYEYMYIKAMIIKLTSSHTTTNTTTEEQKEKHIKALDECKQLLLPSSNSTTTSFSTSSSPLYNIHLFHKQYECIVNYNIDILYILSMEYISHFDAYTPVTVYLDNPNSTTTSSTTSTATLGNNKAGSGMTQSGSGNAYVTTNTLSKLMATQAQMNTMIGPLTSSHTTSNTTSTSHSTTRTKNRTKTSTNTNTSMNIDTIEIPPAVLTGVNILKYLLQICPGYICIYIEISRILCDIGRYDESIRTIHTCLGIHTRCIPALLLKAKIELTLRLVYMYVYIDVLPLNLSFICYIIHICIHILIYTYIYLYTYSHLSIYAYLYIHVYSFIHLYILTYIYT